MNVPFFDITRQHKTIEQEIKSAIDRVLASGKFLLGSESVAFEGAFSSYIGMKHGIGVNSGTDALKIALRVLGIGNGDEVITVTNTAVPTVSAIREVGALPVFVDSDEYFTLDPDQLEEKITSKTKAVIVVHLYGQPADMAAIMTIAKRHKIPIVEDCAQATGAKIADKKVGSFGTLSCFSFYPTKNLGAYGDGGMILTNDEVLAKTCRQLRMYGMEGSYYANIEGYNSRLDEMQAAILATKLPHLEEWNTRRRAIATRYLTEITNPLIMLPAERAGGTHAFHLFVIRTARRDDLKRFLTEKGIGCGIHYEFPIHLQKAYSFLNYKPGGFPTSETGAKEVLSLPIFPELTGEEIESVITAVNQF